MSNTCNLRVQYKRGEKGYKDLKIQVTCLWKFHIPKLTTLIRRFWGKIRQPETPQEGR